MSVFNQNLRYICKRMGLSQQRLADMMGLKRGRVAGYFYNTQAKPDFLERLGKFLNLEIGRFLTVEMQEENYDTFFVGTEEKVEHTASEPEGIYNESHTTVLDLLMQLKNTDDPEERDKLLDEIVIRHGKLLEDNDRLKDQVIELTGRLLQR